MTRLNCDSLVLCLGIATGLCGGCSTGSSQAPTIRALGPTEVVVDDTLVQFSLVAALVVGDYEDGAPLRDVLAEGDFGIGTFNRLDGEMIVLDGQMYQALADGTNRVADLDSTTPFAAVTFFDEDGRIENFAATTLDDLDEQLDRKLPHRNALYAIRIDGEFEKIKLRSVPAQRPPFLPLVDVVKHQVTWEHRNVRGTLVGIRCPAWVGTLNVSGYHWHFLSDERDIGGHVLGCKIQAGLLRFDECTSMLIHISKSSRFDEFDADKIKKHDINQIEGQRDQPGRP